ncbi:hypothetical protein MNBD_GAMMA16-2040 [hydrothermal vent metagenome]|uniref:Uncharacterized protein n=1 Tax=hydrothermal vent metagenome TaxID=652676 RepID=A0A3B0ZDW7_9ZZZZ
MQTVEIILARLIQLVVCLFFTSIIMTYIGGIVMIPLAALYAIISFLDQGIGFNGIVATIIAVPAVGWLGLTVYRIPNLVDKLVDSGLQLIKLAAQNYRKFDNIASNLKEEATPEVKETS